MTMDLSSAFRDRMVRVFGAEGRDWLDRLPRMLAEYADRWGLRIEPPLAQSYNFVAPATRADGTSVIFKCGVVADASSIRAEIAALRHWAGDGAVLVFEDDAPNGVVLLERLVPGQALVELDDMASTRIAAGLMRRLWKPPPNEHVFPTLADWSKAFAKLRERHHGTTGPLPAEMIDRGESLYRDLVASQSEPVLLHGDLHHFNILSAQREPWLIVDPHGVIGEPAFEVGPWLRNTVGDPNGPHAHLYLLKQPNARAVLDRRLNDFSELLEVDRARLRDWGFAFCALSACWSNESNHRPGWEQALAVAGILATL
ncbi:MAG: aminoglycoside phosphotransferase family protein [Dehalococcoidia bacterium]